MEIVVNGRRVHAGLGRQTITFSRVLALAGLYGSPSVTYRYPNGVTGIMAPGDLLAIVTGLTIEASGGGVGGRVV